MRHEVQASSSAFCFLPATQGATNLKIFSFFLDSSSSFKLEGIFTTVIGAVGVEANLKKRSSNVSDNYKKGGKMEEDLGLPRRPKRWTRTNKCIEKNSGPPGRSGIRNRVSPKWGRGPRNRDGPGWWKKLLSCGALGRLQACSRSSPNSRKDSRNRDGPGWWKKLLKRVWESCFREVPPAIYFAYKVLKRLKNIKDLIDFVNSILENLSPEYKNTICLFFQEIILDPSVLLILVPVIIFILISIVIIRARRR